MERDAVSTARIAELEVALSRAASDSELVATLRCELEASQAASGEFQQRCDALSSSLREMGTEMQRAAAASASELEVLGFKLWDTESLLEKRICCSMYERPALINLINLTNFVFIVSY
jgi:hypothetical protein